MHREDNSFNPRKDIETRLKKNGFVYNSSVSIWFNGDGSRFVRFIDDEAFISNMPPNLLKQSIGSDMIGSIPNHTDISDDGRALYTYTFSERQKDVIVDSDDREITDDTLESLGILDDGLSAGYEYYKDIIDSESRKHKDIGKLKDLMYLGMKCSRHLLASCLSSEPELVGDKPVPHFWKVIWYLEKILKLLKERRML